MFSDRPAAARPAAAAPVSEKLPQSVILLVEDDRLSQRLVTKIFAEHEVLVAETATDAMQLLRRNPHVDLAVVDYQLRGEHGSTFVAEVRRHAFCHDLPVIAYTGSRERDVVLRYAELRAQAFHLKPYRADVLLRELAQALAAGRRERLFEPTEAACRRMKLSPEEYAGLLNKGAALLEEDLQRVRQLLLAVNDPRLHTALQHIAHRLPQMGVRIAAILAREAERELTQGDFHACTQTLSVLDSVATLARRRALNLLSLGDSLADPSRALARAATRADQPVATQGVPFHLRPILSQPVGLLGAHVAGFTRTPLVIEDRFSPPAAGAFRLPAPEAWFDAIGKLERMDDASTESAIASLSEIPGFEPTMHQVLVRLEVARPHELGELRWNGIVQKLGVTKAMIFAAAGMLGRGPNKSPLALQRLRAHVVATMLLGFELGRFLRITHPQRVAAAAITREIGLWTLAACDPVALALVLARGVHHGDLGKAEQELLGVTSRVAGARWVRDAGLPALYQDAAADRIEHPDSGITLQLVRLAEELTIAFGSGDQGAPAACKKSLVRPDHAALAGLKALGVKPPVDRGEAADLMIALARSATGIADEIVNPR